MAWIYLLAAGLLEVVWAVGLKYTEGWTKLFPSLITAAAMIGSFYFLSQAIKTIPLGTGYAVWTGIGTVGAAIFGVIVFREAFDLNKFLCILLIVAGIVGLKLSATS